MIYNIYNILKTYQILTWVEQQQKIRDIQYIPLLTSGLIWALKKREGGRENDATFEQVIRFSS